MSECGECEVALVDYKLEVVSTVLIVENEVLLAPDAQPVEDLQASLHQDQVFPANITVILEVEVGPKDPHNLYDKVDAPLQCLDAGQFWDLTFRIEVLDPTPQVLEHRQEVIHVNVRRRQCLYVMELVHESHDLRKIDQLRNF